MAGLFSALLPGALTAGAGVAMAKDITELGEDSAASMQQLGEQVNQGMQFKPYSIKTGVGTSTVAGNGSLDLGVGGGNVGMPDYQQGMSMLAGSQEGLDAQAGWARDSAQTMIDRSLQDPSSRQQQLFLQMQEANAPELQRARSAMETRSYAQGRSGIQGSQYGGSGEQFAQSRAEAEARNRNLVQAQQLGMQEQQMQGQLGTAYGQLGAQAGQAAAGIGGQMAGLGLQGYDRSWMPMQMQLAALREGTNQATMAQNGQISGQNMMAQLGLGGIEARINASDSAAKLYGSLFGALQSPASTIGGIFDSGVGGFLDSGLSGALDNIAGTFNITDPNQSLTVGGRS